MNSISFDDLDGLKIELEQTSGNSGCIRIAFADGRQDLVISCKITNLVDRQWQRITGKMSKKEAEKEMDFDREYGIKGTKIGRYKNGYAIYQQPFCD
jgi:hypothetical protein